MQSMFGERERPNWCVGVSAVTIQHHESLPLTACMNIDSLHERVDRLHEGISDNIGLESVCVSHAWYMYVPITHQYTSLHRLPSLSCPPCFLYHPSSGRWSLWCIIHLFHVAYMFFTDSGKACMNTLRPGGQGRRDSYGSAAMARSSAVRDAKYLSHVTHI